ncbi:PH domain-containing protein [candidate division KSB1 bacterium]|nr:PH domain-containing protein [candidate division KSB1 bacterium]
MPEPTTIWSEPEVLLWEGRVSPWASPLRFFVAPTAYRITNRRLTEVRSHLMRWGKQIRTWDVDRIEYVRVYSSFWQRLFGLADVELGARWQAIRWTNLGHRSALETALTNAGLRIVR